MNNEEKVRELAQQTSSEVSSKAAVYAEAMTMAEWKDAEYAEKINRLCSIIDDLWTALDNIDTYSDLQIDDTDENNPFRVICNKTEKRFEHIKSDGYDLFLDNIKITK